MTVYLEAGWYDPANKKGLRAEVVDGAVDVAGTLLRAGVDRHRMQRIALQVRGFASVANPTMREPTAFGARHRSLLEHRLEALTADIPELHGFVSDCLEHVESVTDLLALYLHFVHITRMLQLLSTAVFSQIEPQVEETEQPPKSLKSSARRKKTVRRAGKKKALARKKTGRVKKKKKTQNRKKAVGKRTKKKTISKKAASRKKKSSRQTKKKVTKKKATRKGVRKKGKRTSAKKTRTRR